MTLLIAVGFSHTMKRAKPWSCLGIARELFVHNVWRETTEHGARKKRAQNQLTFNDLLYCELSHHLVEYQRIGRRLRHFNVGKKYMYIPVLFRAFRRVGQIITFFLSLTNVLARVHDDDIDCVIFSVVFFALVDLLDKHLTIVVGFIFFCFAVFKSPRLTRDFIIIAKM